MVNNFLTCSDCSGTQWLLHLTSSSSWSSTWLWAALVATFQVITLSDWWIAQKTRILIGGWLRNTTFWLADSSENAHSDRRIVLKRRILIGGWLRKHASWLEDGSENTYSDRRIVLKDAFWLVDGSEKNAFWLKDCSENILMLMGLEAGLLIGGWLRKHWFWLEDYFWRYLYDWSGHGFWLIDNTVNSFTENTIWAFFVLSP